MLYAYYLQSMITEDGLYECFLRAEARKHSRHGPKRQSLRPILIRCYHGGQFGNQFEHFQQAVKAVKSKMLNVKINAEYMSLKELRAEKEKKWSLESFVDWLLQSDIHFIISHVHQGMETFGWSIEEIYNELQRLKYHPGFPNMEHLGCSIFTQNKWLYLEAMMPEGRILPSYKLLIPDRVDEVDSMRRHVNE